MPRKSTSSGSRLWKWHTRSNRSASEVELRDSSFASPTTPFPTSHSIPNRFQQQPYSPYLTESAHVASLQNPSISSEIGARQDRPSIGQLPNEISNSVSTLTRASTVVLHSSPTADSLLLGVTPKKLYVKAIKGLESKLRFRAHRQVRLRLRGFFLKLTTFLEADVSYNTGVSWLS